MNWYKKSQFDQSIPFYNDGLNISLFQYISPRKKPNLTPEEKRIREMAYKIKEVGETEAIEYAAKLMSNYVSRGSILIPVPSSSGSSGSNYNLANLISGFTDSTVIDALGRREKVLPLHEMRKVRGLEHERTIEEHKMNLNFTPSDMFSNKKVYLIDNVMTSGSTLNAARSTLKLPEAIGLTFAKSGA